MNLNFGICWIEDQASDAEVEAVETAVRDCGFEPELKRIESDEDIRQHAWQQEHFQKYDLILLDLNLGEELRGDELALDVRKDFRSTPILFYSVEEVPKLLQRMADKRVEGVYCAHRSRLPKRVRELVSDLSPALNRLSGMRGLAASVVAECDDEFRSVLLHWGIDPKVEAKLVESIKKKAEEGKQRSLDEVEEITKLDDLLDHHVSSSNVLFAAVFAQLKVMEKKGERLSDDVMTTRRALGQYGKKVLKIRNTLAHVQEERTTDGWRIPLRGSNPHLTVHDFERFRSDFQAHLRDVKQLRALLIGQ